MARPCLTTLRSPYLIPFRYALSKSFPRNGVLSYFLTAFDLGFDPVPQSDSPLLQVVPDCHGTVLLPAIRLSDSPASYLLRHSPTSSSVAFLATSALSLAESRTSLAGTEPWTLRSSHSCTSDRVPSLSWPPRGARRCTVSPSHPSSEATGACSSTSLEFICADKRLRAAPSGTRPPFKTMELLPRLP